MKANEVLKQVKEHYYEWEKLDMFARFAFFMRKVDEVLYQIEMISSGFNHTELDREITALQRINNMFSNLIINMHINIEMIFPKHKPKIKARYQPK